MYGYIYKTTNLVNGKIYIGKKKGEFTTSYKGSGKYLKNAINKYGIENFSVCLIEYCDTLSVQNERERYWISYYENLGYEMYNISKGGDGGDTYYRLSDSDRHKRVQNISKSSHFHKLDAVSHYKGWDTRRLNGTDKFTDSQLQKMSESHKGHKVSDETKKKISKAVSGKNHPLYGTHRSSETKLKISIKNKGRKMSDEFKKKQSVVRMGENNAFYGKTHTKETKALIGSYNKERFSNRVWINNGKVNKRVLIDEVNNYKTIGFTEGRIKWGHNH